MLIPLVAGVGGGTPLSAVDDARHACGVRHAHLMPLTSREREDG